MKTLLKKFIPLRLQRFVKQRYYDLRGVRYKSLYTGRNRGRTVYFLGVPRHSNLGDYAIAQAVREFLDSFPIPYDRVVERGVTDFYEHLRLMKKFISQDDLILINGGGSMGVEWFRFEEMIREAITAFPLNRIIIMPETMYYGDSRRGRRELANAVRIYSKHPDLHIFAREKQSYEMMKESFPRNHIYLAPDMVLYMNRTNETEPRGGILFCMRDDPEKLLSCGQESELITIARKLDPDIRRTDTVLTDLGNIPEIERNGVIEKKLGEFRRSRLVVTDRLHGMVFSAITGTPCLALSNYNHKISGVYEWISGLDYIEFSRSPEGPGTSMERLYSMGSCNYDEKRLSPFYDDLRAVIKGES